MDIPAAGTQPTAHVNVSTPGVALAGFQVSIIGRIRVSTEAMDRWPRSVWPIQCALIVWLMVLSPLYWKARAALVTGSARVLSAEGTMDRIRSIVRQYPAGGQAYVQNKPFLLWHDLNFPGLAAVFVLSNPDNTLDGRRVHFIESDPELLGALKREGGRVADLLVSGEEPTVVREMF